mmetsp:Transcript_14641/g.27493  ORF Transcript_14641/g.27493 Transcript_14641/m.27493 type:complete len:275 (+) Transcript_14641:685-1509(+)
MWQSCCEQGKLVGFHAVQMQEFTTGSLLSESFSLQLRNQLCIPVLRKMQLFSQPLLECVWVHGHLHWPAFSSAIEAHKLGPASHVRPLYLCLAPSTVLKRNGGRLEKGPSGRTLDNCIHVFLVNQNSSLVAAISLFAGCKPLDTQRRSEVVHKQHMHVLQSLLKVAFLLLTPFALVYRNVINENPVSVRHEGSVYQGPELVSKGIRMLRVLPAMRHGINGFARLVLRPLHVCPNPKVCCIHQRFFAFICLQVLGLLAPGKATPLWQLAEETGAY